MKHDKSIIVFLLLLGMATLSFAQTNCLSFDGVNDYVGFGDILEMGTSDWSYQIWFKTSALTGGLMGKSITAGTSGRWSIHFSTASTGCLRVIFSGSTTINLDAAEKPGGGTWNDGTWHNATVTCDRDGFMTLYMDGNYNNKLSISGSSTNNMQNTGHFFIGAYGDQLGTSPNSALYFNGSLDEARVWNKCLTPAEVAANWDTQISPSADNLVGYWRMNEGTGTTLNDLSASNNSGTLYPLPYSSGPTWNASGPETLPVELSSFTVNMNASNMVMVQWVTQSETNVSGFQIYRGMNDQLADATLLNAFINATNTSQTQYYVYYDSELETPGTYYYWLESVDFDGSISLFGPLPVHYETIDPGIPSIPAITGIAKNYPNPFNPSTTVVFGMHKDGELAMDVYNTRGQKVRSIYQGSKKSGWYHLEWDGKNDNGQQLNSGVYFFRMQANGETHLHKTVMLK